MVLNLEHPVPVIGASLSGGKRSLKLSGTIDYTAFVVEQAKHRTSPPHIIYLAHVRLQVHSNLRLSSSSGRKPQAGSSSLWRSWAEHRSLKTFLE